MKHKALKKILAMFLTFALVISTITAGAENRSFETADVPLAIADDFIVETSMRMSEIPEIVGIDMVRSNNHVERLTHLETDLNTVVFRNADGTNTMYLFNEAVQFVDENGATRDKSNRLHRVASTDSRSRAFAYTNADNDIRTYFPRNLSNSTGITLTDGEFTIERIPHFIGGVVSNLLDTNSASVDNRATSLDYNWVYYDSVFGRHTAVRYTPIFEGFKEEVVLYRNIGVNRFDFTVRTNGLSLTYEGGTFSLVEPSTGDVVGGIGEIFVYDSSDDAIARAVFGDYRHFYEMSIVRENAEYRITIVVDESFLANAVYPVFVDPPFTLNPFTGTTKNILDTPIYNGSGATSVTAGGNSTAVIGVAGVQSNGANWGAGRLLMRFPGLAGRNFMNANHTIFSARLHMRELSGNSDTGTISVRRYNDVSPAWDESTRFSAAIWDGGASTQITSGTFSHPNNVNATFNITSIANTWRTNATALSRGIMLRNTTSTTSETTGVSQRKIFAMTENASNRPFLEITYFRNGSRAPSSSSSLTMNCHGFAFFTDDVRFDALKTQHSNRWNDSSVPVRQRNRPIMPSYPINHPNDLVLVNHNASLASFTEDMRAWLNQNFSGRWSNVTTQGHTATLSEEQWLVAMRVGAGTIDNPGNNSQIAFFNTHMRFDYHFWYRASNGLWYDKPGQGNSRQVSSSVIDPASSAANSTGSWSLYGQFYYRSSTVFYAVR
jgi:hypothetical protein